MPWIKDTDDRSYLQKLCTAVLKKGRIPGHVGFILDGNRRYARGHNIDTVEGHKKGFDKLSSTLRWCLDLGISEVTIYVFSIENFKRPKEEVEGLMSLAKEKFGELLKEEETLMKESICIQIVGDHSLIPQDLRPLFAKAMLLTRSNTRSKLNIAFAYTSRNEITRGVRNVREGLENGDLEESDVTKRLLEESFSLLPSAPVDLIVRTSGETRLSDFLLWQGSHAVVYFADVLWPEFSYWELLRVVFKYQVDLKGVNQVKSNTEEELSSRQKSFLKKIRSQQWTVLEEEAGVRT